MIIVLQIILGIIVLGMLLMLVWTKPGADDE